MACAWLVAAGARGDGVPEALRAAVPEERWDAVAQLAERGFAAPVTTSAGRLFDAVAALCGLRAEVTYEGQAAIELEAIADPAAAGAYALGADLDARGLVLAVRDDVRAGVPAATVAMRFHRALAGATAAACARAASAAGLGLVVLSGGVFQNRLLLADTAGRLEALGLRVLVPAALPANDGGIAYGQAAVAAARG